MHIGMIGGIGPAATTHYYRLLLDRMNEIELTIFHARLKTLGPNVAAGNIDKQATIFSGHIDSLKAAGADINRGTFLHRASDQTLGAAPRQRARQPQGLLHRTWIQEDRCSRKPEGDANAVLLGGTDLSLAFGGKDVSYWE